MSCLTKYCIKLSFVCRKKNCMRWYSFLFSIILGFVIPNSSDHCTCQRIFIMYSYICVMFYFCTRQNFVCHTKLVASVPSHHWPAKGSSVMLLPLIIPRKSILSPPLISPPVHADSPSHVTSETVNQPREEVLCLCRWSVHPCPLEVALCCCRQSYQEKCIVLPPSISPPALADSPSHVASQTANQPREEESWLCHWSVHPRLLEVVLCCRRQSYQEKALCCRCWSVCPRPLIFRCTSVAKSLTSWEKKHCVSAVNQSTRAC